MSGYACSCGEEFATWERYRRHEEKFRRKGHELAARPKTFERKEVLRGD